MNKFGFMILGASLVSWSLLLVASRIILLTTQYDPWMFTLIQMMIGGAFLFLVSRGSASLKGVLSDPFIWCYGILRVATAALFTAALVHTSTANAAFLGVISVPMSMIVLWLIMRRRPTWQEIPGHFVILAGLAILALNLEGGWRNPAVILMLLSELCVVVSTIIAEFHPLNQTENVWQRARLTGVMLLASAFAMIVAALGIGILAQDAPVLQGLIPTDLTWIINPWSIFDPMLWVVAGLVGVLLRGPSLFLSLTAIYRVRTENYIAGMAALPFINLGFEAIASWAGMLPPIQSPVRSLLFGAAISLGSLLVLFARSRQVRTTSLP